jgi:hypothetical protein
MLERVVNIFSADEKCLPTVRPAVGWGGAERHRLRIELKNASIHLGFVLFGREFLYFRGRSLRGLDETSSLGICQYVESSGGRVK